MSGLFLVQPVGVGTPAIEALPSYLMRVASEHSVTPAVLLARLLSGVSVDPQRECALIMRSDIAVLCRPNDSSHLVQRAAARGTRLPAEQVRSMTFLGLLPGLARPLNTFSPSLRWCPACFAESSRLGEPVYFKLLWQLLPVVACDVHRVRLRTKCPSCGSRQGGFGRVNNLSMCRRCSGALGRISSADRTDAFADPEYVSLVGLLSADPSICMPKGALASVIRALFNDAWNSDAERELYRRIPRDHCLRFANPDEPVTLPAARRIAGMLGIPLTDLLLGRIEGSPRPIPFGEPGGGAKNSLGESPHPLEEPACMKHRFSRMVRSARAVSGRLCLREAADRLGISVGGLQYRFPGLCRSLSATRREALSRARIVRDQQIAAVVSSAIHDASPRADRPVGRKALLRRLRHETGLPKHRLRLAIRQELETREESKGAASVADSDPSDTRATGGDP